MFKLIQSELFKLKRSKLFLIVILSSIAPSGFMFLGLHFGNVGPITMNTFLNEILLYSLMLFNIMVYALLAGHLIVKEYNDHTIKSILTTPVSKNGYIIGKFLSFELIVILLTIFSFILSVIFGYMGGATDITLNILEDYFIKFLAGNLLVSVVSTPFILISLIFKNIVPTVIAGVIMSLANSMLVNQIYAPLSPFCTPFLIVTNELGNYSYGVNTPVLILILTSIIGLILSIVYFYKADVSL